VTFRERIDRVKDAVDIESVVLKVGGDIRFSYGDWQKTHCPFHDDQIASAATNMVAGVFTCHVCDVHGDVVSVARFYLEMEEGDGSMGRALEWLEELGGLDE